MLTLDIICHGVPSAKVWQKYLSLREREEGHKIVNASFRGKETGWREYVLSLSYNNGMIKYYSVESDYMLGNFHKNTSLRPSCYTCSFKEEKRQSDITIADFWGIEHVLKELDDNKGTSMVLINSDKGRNVYSEIAKNLIYKSVNSGVPRFFSSCFTTSVLLPVGNKRTEFFKNLDSATLDLK